MRSSFFFLFRIPNSAFRIHVALGLASLLAVTSAALASNCAGTFTGFAALNDLGAGSYKGQQGGLYPQGLNQRPPAHEAAGLQQAASVGPRNGSGAVDDQNGRIVLLSIGMSNATAEFSVFKQIADRDPEKNPRLAIVDGALGGWSADRIVSSSGGDYWSMVDSRLQAAGVTGAQVQAVWMKEADAGPTQSFPNDARRLESELKTIAQTLRSRFPNLRLLYHSSRIYAGYASSSLNPEPFAYQSGFAVKWLIEEQIQGNADLSFEAGRAPWMAWGPYLWADGTHARSDGLGWICSDLADDGTHPSVSGRNKVAALLLDFLKTDTTSRPWFVGAPQQPSPAPRPAALVNAASYQPLVAPGSIAALFGTQLAASASAASTLPLPHTMGGVRVGIGGELAPLFYVSPEQINLRIPLTAAAGGAVTAFRDEARSDPLAAAQAPSAPGIFTQDSSGMGLAAAVHLDGRMVTVQQPARRDEILMLFGTGLGLTGPVTSGPNLPAVSVGGLPAQVLFAGPAPFFVGLDQVNFTVPGNAPVGPSVPLQLVMGNAASNSVMLPVGG